MFQINWKTKALLFKFLNFFKLYKLLFFIQKRITKRSRVNLKGVFFYWDHHLKYLKENNFHTKMILQVHDELIFEVPNNEISNVPYDIANIMENASKPVIDLRVRLKADVGIGNSWADAH